jgi:hypothetical protein
MRSPSIEGCICVPLAITVGKTTYWLLGEPPAAARTEGLIVAAVTHGLPGSGGGLR